MPKLIAVLFTETNRLHAGTQYEMVTLKNLHLWARMLFLSYHIGHRDPKTNEFVLKKKVSTYIKPKHLIIPENISKINDITVEKMEKKGEELETVLTNFKNDMKGVSVIVSHNLPFHLKTIQAEMFRCMDTFYITRYLFIDTINFNHDYGYLKLEKLANKVLNKDYSTKSRRYRIVIIKKIFMKLYFQHENRIKTNV